jgi:excisionase family DNA binding protein
VAGEICARLEKLRRECAALEGVGSQSTLRVRPWLTKADVAGLAGVSTRTVDRAIHAGELCAARPTPRNVRIRPDWAEEWLEQLRR